jgi:DNA-binding NarL/FixJ family response regulator
MSSDDLGVTAVLNRPIEDGELLKVITAGRSKRPATGTAPETASQSDETRVMPERQAPRARIAVIDDDQVLVELVQSLLVEEGFEVVQCSNWLKAHAFVLAERPDLVLLDLRFGDAEHGWRVLDHLTLDPSTQHLPVIIWSGAHESLHARAPALLAEHNIFVMTKPFEFETLLAAVEQALRQYPPMLRLDGRRRSHEIVGDGDSKRLTPREHEVAELITRGFTNRQIADALVLSPGTVANHVARILEKLEFTSRVRIATWMLDAGFRTRAEDDQGQNRLLA